MKYLAPLLAASGQGSPVAVMAVADTTTTTSNKPAASTSPLLKQRQPPRPYQPPAIPNRQQPAASKAVMSGGMTASLPPAALPQLRFNRPIPPRGKGAKVCVCAVHEAAIACLRMGGEEGWGVSVYI